VISPIVTWNFLYARRLDRQRRAEWSPTVPGPSGTTVVNRQSPDE
jgi:hypothetical protein